MGVARMFREMSWWKLEMRIVFTVCQLDWYYPFGAASCFLTRSRSGVTFLAGKE